MPRPITRRRRRPTRRRRRPTPTCWIGDGRWRRSAHRRRTSKAATTATVRRGSAWRRAIRRWPGSTMIRICSQVSGHVFRRFEPTETAGEDGDEGYQNESDEACVRPVEDRIQPAIAAEPSEGSLDDPSDFGGNEFSFGAPHLGLDLDSKILPRGLQVFSLI